MLAGADLPEEERRLQDVVAARGWARRAHVANDTFAVLRAGTERGWGVAVVCGAGINCVGVAPDGRRARFPALGAITGDWGGGYDVGLAALSAAARSADGRGPRTALERAVGRAFRHGGAGRDRRGDPRAAARRPAADRARAGHARSRGRRRRRRRDQRAAGGRGRRVRARRARAARARGRRGRRRARRRPAARGAPSPRHRGGARARGGRAARRDPARRRPADRRRRAPRARCCRAG